MVFRLPYSQYVFLVIDIIWYFKVHISVTYILRVIFLCVCRFMREFFIMYWLKIALYFVLL